MSKQILMTGKSLLVLVIFFLAITVAISEEVMVDDNTVNPTAVGRLYHTLAEKKKPTGIILMPGVTMGVLVEAEAGYEKQGDDSSSDLNLSTFGMGIDAELQEGIEGHVYFLWEDGDDAIDIDEGYIKLGSTEEIPFHVQAGRMYLPFGVYHSHFVSDPMTLDLGESRKEALLLGYDTDFIQLSAGAFNGEFDNPDNDHINDFVAALTITPVESVEAGIYWISDLGEAGGLEDILHENIDATDEKPAIKYNSVNGYGGYVHVEKGIVTVDVEYIAAVGKVDVGILQNISVTPKAWNAEVAVAVRNSIELAARIEGSDDFVGMPEIQYGIAGTYGFTDNVVVTVEYLRGEFDDDAPGRDIVTAQLGMAF